MNSISYHRYTCPSVFIVALFTIVRKWKQLRRPSTGGWILKMWCIYIMELYSAVKESEIMTFSGKWMEVENIIILST